MKPKTRTTRNVFPSDIHIPVLSPKTAFNLRHLSLPLVFALAEAFVNLEAGFLGVRGG
jgi:hypothetical protein